MLQIICSIGENSWKCIRWLFDDRTASQNIFVEYFSNNWLAFKIYSPENCQIIGCLCRIYSSGICQMIGRLCKIHLPGICRMIKQHPKYIRPGSVELSNSIAKYSAQNLLDDRTRPPNKYSHQ